MQRPTSSGFSCSRLGIHSGSWCQVERHGIAVVHIRKDRKWDVAVDFELGCVLLPLGDDGHDLRAITDNNVMYLHESVNVDPAVRAPMGPDET